ncbi:Oleate hydroxylase FAH12 [Penicillium oxalicum]|uniref:Oleate hydroxylase FAH12 n=1 Tax=Penicillium oxalicum TaxID=69781 RepID=UPI0020B7DCB6|nr:Oleate hydroxylase FAH12 [Penicillium oxalicum]KAI2790497.1 Oleate hydroxylase FAH12 [Penicillium oxalicum]
MASSKVQTIEPVTYRLKAEAQPEEITYGFLRSKIPAHCFERSATKSLAYLARDLVYASILVWASTYIEQLPTTWMRVGAWITYTFLQGCVGVGIWILGHECGHGAFSPYSTLNDVVGWATHSLLMVPYFSWKITHARHHRYHCHIEKDTVFVPPTDEYLKTKVPTLLNKVQELFEETPFYNAAALLSHQLLGWQTYLMFNVSAGSKSLPEKPTGPKALRNSHFDPLGSLFTDSQAHLIAITDLGLLIVGGTLYYLATQMGAWKIALLYVVPYFWVHHWLVAITYLHHTHPTVPHYDADAWTFVKGALSTVDRRFGFIGRHFFHEIIDYHVVHHLFPKIPFYHAEEATNAIVPYLGDQYHLDEGMFLKSLVDTFNTCKVVSDVNSDGVLHWKIPENEAKKLN